MFEENIKNAKVDNIQIGNILKSELVCKISYVN